jgi:hypothetical protein
MVMGWCYQQIGDDDLSGYEFQEPIFLLTRQHRSR